MTTSPMLRRVAVACLLTTFSSPALAQSREEVAQSAKQALVDLRQAVVQGDWSAMSAMLPAGTPWYRAIEEMVKTQKPNDQSYSFWRTDSDIPSDSLSIQVMADGRVSVRAPLFVRGERGQWEAFLRHTGSRWQLDSTRESWGARYSRRR